MRKRAGRWAALLLMAAAAPAGAIVAGAPPDTPAARVEANRSDSPFAGVGSISVLAADGRTTTGVYSGCLVARRWVLTAGHVAAGQPAERLRFNLNLTGDLSHVLGVRRVLLHPNFRALPGQQYADDLGCSNSSIRRRPAHPSTHRPRRRSIPAPC